METLLAHFKKDTFKVLADAMPQMVWMASPTGELQYCNKKWYDYSGFEADGNELENWLSVLHPDDMERVRNAWYNSLITLEPYEIEYRFSSKSEPDRYRWFLTRALPLRDKNGSVIKWIGTCTDIDDLKRTQESLRATQEKLNLAFDGARVGTWDWDIAKNKLSWHGKLRELYGLNNDAALTAIEDFFDCVHPDDRAAVHEAGMLAIVEGRAYDVEFRVPTADGSVRWLSGKGAVQRDTDGTPLRMSGINVDITARKQTELALQLTEERYQHLFKSNPQPMWVFDASTYRFLTVNAAALDHYGYTEEEFLSMTVADIRPAEDVERFKNTVASAETTRLTHDGGWRHRKKDGTLIDVEITTHGVVFAGHAARLVLVHDISERKKAQLELAKSQQQLKLITDIMPVYVAHCDVNSRYKFVSKAYANVLGLTPDDFIGKSISDVLGHDAFRAVEKYINQAMTGQRVDFEVVMPIEQLGKRFMHATYVPEFDANNRVIGLVVAIADVTERRLAEQTLKNLEDRLVSSNEPISETYPRSIVISHARGFRNLNLSDITHLEAVQGYCVIYLTNGEKIMSSKNLSEYEKLLADKNFHSVHRSYILSLEKFSELKSENGLVAVMTNGALVPVSRRMSKSLSELVKRGF